MSVSHAQPVPRVETSSLVQMLAGISDPRDPRGVRHPLVAVLAMAVVATLAGASNYRELGSVAADLPQSLLAVLGARTDPRRGCFLVPSAATLRRVLIALDAAELDRAVGAWLGAHAACDGQGWAIALDGKDLNGSFNDDGRLTLFSAMAHRRDHGGGVVLAQTQVPPDSTETTRVAQLLETIDMTGALVTADAAHTCIDTARHLVEQRQADYLLTIKGNRASLHAAALSAARAAITHGPAHVREERAHGRISRWTTWTTPITSDIGLPHATQLAVIRRDVADLARQPLSQDIALVATSRDALSAAEITTHTRRHWHIENLVHRPRDTIWHEDDHQAYLGNGPRAMATLRNLALGLLHLHGITKIKQTVQAIGRNPHRATPLIT